MWKYVQSTGKLYDKTGALISTGYSGKARGKNNPALQGVRGMGPIPRGIWKMVRVYNSPNVGPYAIELHAVDVTPNNDTHDETGRGAFRVHGDSIKHPGEASNGCIIEPLAVRKKLWPDRGKTPADPLIEVVA